MTFGDIERIAEKEVVAYFKLLFRDLLGVVDVHKENLSYVDRCPG
jgi:hypothetical protein